MRGLLNAAGRAALGIGLAAAGAAAAQTQGAVEELVVTGQRALQQNLTDTKLRQYFGGPRDWIVNYERLRQTYYVGISARW